VAADIFDHSTPSVVKAKNVSIFIFTPSAMCLHSLMINEVIIVIINKQTIEVLLLFSLQSTDKRLLNHRG
jgi:siroheme synthase (precorrin-2 oxidase/ferrochelatase)